MQQILDYIREDLKDLRAEFKNDFNILDSKVDSLLESRWKIYGASFVISILLTVAFQVLLAILQKG